MKNRTWTTGAIGMLAAVATAFFPVDPGGFIWIPGSLSLLFAALSIISTRREPHPDFRPGSCALILYLGGFLFPLLARVSSETGPASILLLPLLGCILLISVHTYLGIQVISRGVIFVDLSLAQMASLGAILAFSGGVELYTNESYLAGLGFALLGGVFFAVSRLKESRIPQEAVIGIVYAVATAAAMLLVEKHPEGGDVIKGALTGRILWIDPRTMITTSRIYAVAAIFLFLFSGRFDEIARSGGDTAHQGPGVRKWDLLFYMIFAVVITKAVELSGVLLVFSFLVIPAVTSSILSKKPWKRLLIGWISGSVASIIGLIISYRFDMSAGPAIVAVLTILLVFVAFAHTLASSPRPFRMLLKMTAGLSVPAVVLILLYVTSPLGRGEDGTHGHLNQNGTEAEIHSRADPGNTGHPAGSLARHLLDRFFEDPDDTEVLSALREHESGLIHLLRDESADVREAAAAALGRIGDGPIVEKELEEAFLREEDDWVRFEIARSLFSIDHRKGGGALLTILDEADTPTFLKAEAAGMLREASGRGSGYDPEGSAEENRKAIKEWKTFFGPPPGR